MSCVIKKRITILILFFTLFSKIISEDNDNMEFLFPYGIQIPFYKGISPFIVATSEYKSHKIIDIQTQEENLQDEATIKYSFLPRIEKIENENDSEITYKYFEDTRMRFFKSEDVSIALQKDDDYEIRVFKEDKNVKQKKYDKYKRLIEQIIWEEKNSNYEITEEKQIFYLTENDKFPQYSINTNYVDKTQTISEYNDINLVTNINTYQLDIKENEKPLTEKKEIEKKSKIISNQNYSYDKEKRVISEQLTKNNLCLLTKYDYSKKFSFPDEESFENEKIKSKKIYSADNIYSYEVFLDEEFSVKSIYKDSIKQSVVYYKNGKEIRKMGDKK